MKLSTLLGFYLPWLMSDVWTAAAAKRGSPASAKQTGSKGGRGLRKLREVVGWSRMDFNFPSEEARQRALGSGTFKPENSLPLGLEVHGSRFWVTLPRWRSGVPATLATAPIPNSTLSSTSPKLDPYPNWSWHNSGNCNGITSVFRIAVDECRRLWVLDSGKVDIVSSVKPVCPAQILVFDLKTDTLLWRYKFPKYQTPHGSLLTNIVVDVREDQCDDAYAYISDVFRYGLLVFGLKDNKSWRIDHPYFYPDPLTTKFNLDGIKFSWTDGIFGLALSPPDELTGEKSLYFHPLSSFREFHVPAGHLRNETLGRPEGVSPVGDPFKKLGEPRRKSRGHASGSAIDRYGVLFYNLVSKSAVGCWNSKTGQHDPRTQGIVARDPLRLSFPNDLKVDHEPEQSVWVLSNRLHKFIYSKLEPDEINFRILTAKVRDAVEGTPCAPGYSVPPPRKPRRKCQEL